MTQDKHADDKVTISAVELFRLIPDVETARVYLEHRRWGGQPVCPHCACVSIYARTGERTGYYQCRTCRKEFTVRTGSIFERSRVALHKWIYAMYLVVTARKGISSMQLSKEIGVTQTTAWFMLGRMREACGSGVEAVVLAGIVEVDETYVGGKEMNKHASKKLRIGRGTVGKMAVLGMRERGGRTVAKPISSTDKETLGGEVRRHVEPGATVYTDEHGGYRGLEDAYQRGVVVHAAGEYVGANAIHTNSIESAWALLKRGIYGTWHKVSRKHLARYVNECSFRLNDANVRVHTMQRLEAFADRAFRHRITYRELTA